MKSHWIQLAALFLATAALAQDPAPADSSSKLDEFMDVGMEVSGVSAPYYDEDGALVARLYGGHAKVLDVDRAEITHLRIDLFQDEEVFATVYVPKCVTKVVDQDERRVLEVESDGDVLLEMDEVSIIGKGFRFSSAENRFEIYHDSKVLVKEAARRFSGGNP